MNNQWKNIQHMKEGTCLVLVKEDVLRRAYFEDINHTGWAIVEGELYAVNDHYVDEAGATINEMAIDLNNPLDFKSETMAAIIVECFSEENIPFLDHIRGITKERELPTSNV